MLLSKLKTRSSTDIKKIDSQFLSRNLENCLRALDAGGVNTGCTGPPPKATK